MLQKVIVVLGALAVAPWVNALSIDPFYAGSYTVNSIGSVPQLPTNYGGLTFLDNDTILIGGAANQAPGRIYQVDVVRGAGNHITGFSGTATLYGNMGTYNDGGVVIGPGGVLFTSQWPVNKLGQTKPGSNVEDKVIDLGLLGVAGSHAALNFVPAGFGGAGRIKLVSYIGGQWYDAQLAPDGNGTYDLIGLSQVLLANGNNVPGGPEGFVYIAGGNPLFANNSMLEKTNRLPKFVITIGAWRSVDLDFRKYNIPFKNYFDASGLGQKSPGLFLSNVPHYQMQAAINDLIWKVN